MEKVPKLPVAKFDRNPKAADTLAAELVVRQLFFEQKVFLYVKTVFSDKICQKNSLGHEICQVLLLCYPTFCTAGLIFYF